eukprot:Tamp_23698.p1 GENE.Tamp_23698~~Tamp_23698.p1  ORF type:complete len:165 (+),score=30.24 Tamp_23698:504-998(+)
MPRALTVVCRVLCGRCVRRMLCMHRTPRPTCRPFETSRHACVPWRQLEELKKVPAERVIRYEGGYLHKDAAAQMIALYSHVIAQGDEADGAVYGTRTPFNRNTELPQYYPKDDGSSGMTRHHRFRMALECDVWQWYSIGDEGFTLLDALVWMGVQMKRLFDEQV